MKTLYETMEESFDLLNPYQKALFIDARLSWATNGGLCGEVHKRMCHPITEDDYAQRH